MGTNFPCTSQHPSLEPLFETNPTESTDAQNNRMRSCMRSEYEVAIGSQIPKCVMISSPIIWHSESKRQFIHDTLSLWKMKEILREICPQFDTTQTYARCVECLVHSPWMPSPDAIALHHRQ